MTLPASGPLSFTDIQTEFGGTNPIGLNEYYAGGGLVPAGTTGTFGAVPSSGAISIQNFYGTSAIVPQAISLSSIGTPFIQAWPWSSSGFGTRYANPSPLPTSMNYQAINLTNTAIAFPQSAASPFVSVRAFSISTGYGTAFANPGTVLTAAPQWVEFSPLGNFLATPPRVTPFIAVYAWSGSGFGAKSADPATAATSNPWSVAWRPQQDAIVTGNSSTPWINGWAWSGSSFGTKYANPASLPGALGAGVEFSNSGNFIAIANNSTPFIRVYNWSSGFGTLVANPATIPPSAGLSVTFNTTDTAIAVCGGNFASPYNQFIHAYRWSGSGFGTKYTDPSGATYTRKLNGVDFNRDSTAIAIGSEVAPFLTAYPWTTASGFGTKFADPAVIAAVTSVTPVFTN